MRRGRIVAGVVVTLVGIVAAWTDAAQAEPFGAVSIFAAGLKEQAFPRDLVVGPDGNIWFDDQHNTPAVGRITPTGEITEFIGLMTDESYPRGLVVGSDGNLWFADRGSIGRISTEGRMFEVPVVSNSGSGEPSLALGPDGNVWFTEAGTIPTIGRINPALEVTTFSTHLPTGSKPQDITSGPDGDLWFTDLGTTPAIGRMTASGEVTEFTNGLAAGTEPGRLIHGPEGDLWFIADRSPYSESDPTIDRITPSGAITSFPLGSENTCSFTCSVSSLTFAPDGNLWFLDWIPIKGPTLGRMTPAGTVTLFSLGEPSVEDAGDLILGAEGDLWLTTWSPGIESATALLRVTKTGAVTRVGLPGAGVSELTVGPDADIWFTDGYAFGRLNTHGAPASPPGPAPSTPARPGARLSVKAKRLVIDAHGTAVLPITCTGTVSCEGRLTLTTRIRPKGRRASTLVLASITFSIPADTTKTLHLRLTSSAVRLLRTHHRPWPVLLTITKAAPQPVQTSRETVTLTATRARSRHRST